MLKLKLQYFGHLMQRVDSLEKTLMLGGIGGRRRKGRQGMRRLETHSPGAGRRIGARGGGQEEKGTTEGDDEMVGWHH